MALGWVGLASLLQVWGLDWESCIQNKWGSLICTLNALKGFSFQEMCEIILAYMGSKITSYVSTHSRGKSSGIHGESGHFLP